LAGQKWPVKNGRSKTAGQDCPVALRCGLTTGQKRTASAAAESRRALDLFDGSIYSRCLTSWSVFDQSIGAAEQAPATSGTGQILFDRWSNRGGVAQIPAVNEIVRRCEAHKLCRICKVRAI
jgi:hypothetical protein